MQQIKNNTAVNWHLYALNLGVCTVYVNSVVLIQEVSTESWSFGFHVIL